MKRERKEADVTAVFFSDVTTVLLLKVSLSASVDGQKQEPGHEWVDTLALYA